MTSQSPYPILTWSRNTRLRCTEGEPPIRFHWPSSNGVMLRLASRLSRLARSWLDGDQTHDVPDLGKEMQ